jgi:hypothetical protein
MDAPPLVAWRIGRWLLFTAVVLGVWLGSTRTAHAAVIAGGSRVYGSSALVVDRL